MSIFCGIDNGIGGGLAFYDSEKNVLEAMPMPIVSVKKAKGNKNEYSIAEIVGILTSRPITFAVIERAQAFPGQGVVSMFNIGRGFGIMEGMLAALEIPYMVVHSKTWQKKMFEGVAHTDTKQASVLVAQRLFPGVKFVGSDRATKLHNGMTDAALMAYYGTKI